MDQKPRRPRGVRLSDLDRSKVYRIGYVSERRRWETLGPEGQTGEHGADREARTERAQPEAAQSVHAPGRHRATEGTDGQRGD